MDSLTHKFTDRAYDWLVSFGPRVLMAIALFFFGQWVIRFLNKELRKILSGKRVDVTLRPFLLNLFAILMQVALVLGIMQLLGIRMTIFAAVIGAFGVAAGLALSGTFQNFASGILIILLKPFKVGDNINTQGQEGTVTSIRLFYTVVLTYDNTTVIVPNSKLSNEITFNLSFEGKRRIDVDFKFNYGVDFEKVKSIALETINSYENCLKEPAPRVGIQKLEADGFTVTINAWTTAHGFQDTRLAFQERLMRNVKAAGVKLPGMT
jgi:small conductance mechanosensitive channel